MSICQQACPGSPYFNEERDFRANVGRESADFLVLGNVLHEIDPLDWLPLFSGDGFIQWLLKPNGYILIVEDMEMRVGEKAHQRGFVVLDTADIRVLFGVKELQTGFVMDDARGEGRSNAHLVPASCVGNVSASFLREALKQVKHLAKEEIKILRQGNTSCRAGRKHAFYCQVRSIGDSGVRPSSGAAKVGCC